MRNLILILAAFCWLLVSCDAKKPTSNAVDKPEMLNGSWEVNYLATSTMAVNDLYRDKKPFMLFNIKESKVSGNTGCNSFTGNIISMSNGQIRFDDSMVMTRIFCEGGGENVFVENMKAVQGFSFSDDGKTLHLTAKDGQDVMRLAKK